MKRFGLPLWPRRSSSAQTAKNRLQILLAHERSGSTPDYLPQLQREILEVIRRHVTVDEEAIDIRMEQGKELSSLEINIELPRSRP
ncbi:MAG: cell division topological specificity factor MinE [Allgaiera sp.]|jgi:cell division topological specificity factor|nr:cell division topological specificity factor MinE [Allgaiera sp.]